MGKAAKGGDGPGRDATGRKGEERIEYGTAKRKPDLSSVAPLGSLWSLGAAAGRPAGRPAGRAGSIRFRCNAITRKILIQSF